MSEILSLDEAPEAVWQTERMSLHLLAETDFALYRDIYTDAALMRHVGQPLSVDRTEPSFRRTLSDNGQRPWQRLTWKLQARAGGETVGLLGVSRAHPETTVAEMGTMILAGCQQRGLATEALTGLLHRSTATPTITTLRIRHQAGNHAVSQMCTRLMFALTQSSNGWQIWQRHISRRLID